MKRPYKITVQEEPSGEWSSFVWGENTHEMIKGQGKSAAEATLDLVRQLIDKIEWEAISTPVWAALRPNPNPVKPEIIITDDVSKDDERIAEAMASSDHAIYVFEANKVGIHQTGTALTAFARWGAAQGRPDGQQGRSYAIYTMTSPARGEIPINEIRMQIKRLLTRAANQPENLFVITRIGTQADIPGLVMAEMFKGAPKNVNLPLSWRDG